MNLIEDISRIKTLMGLLVESITLDPEYGEYDLIRQVSDNNYDASIIFNHPLISNVGKDCYKDSFENIKNNWTVENNDCFIDKLNEHYIKKESDNWQKSFIEAKDWFRNWFSKEETKSKFEKNYGFEKEKVNEIFLNYLKNLDELKLEMYTDWVTLIQNPKKDYPKPSVPASIAFVYDKKENKPEKKNFVFGNALIPDFIKKNVNTTEILIHEIQHALSNNVMELNPSELIKSVSDSSDEKISRNEVKKRLMNELSIDNSDVEKIFKNWGEFFNKKDMSNETYTCDNSEQNSRIEGMRYLFKTDTITIDMLKPYILLGPNSNISPNISFFIACWAEKGYGSIKTMLDKANSLVYNKSENEKYS